LPVQTLNGQDKEDKVEHKMKLVEACDPLGKKDASDAELLASLSQRGNAIRLSREDKLLL